MATLTSPVRTRHHAGRTSAAPRTFDHDLWQIVRSAREGLLSYESGRGPRSIPVSYLADVAGVTVLLPDFNEPAHYLHGRVVQLDVLAPEPRGEETVTVRGRALEIPAVVVPARDLTGLQTWPADLGTHCFLISPAHIARAVDRCRVSGSPS